MTNFFVGQLCHGSRRRVESGMQRTCLRKVWRPHHSRINTLTCYCDLSLMNSILSEITDGEDDLSLMDSRGDWG